MDAEDRSRIIEVSDLLHRAAAPQRVLSAIAWPSSVRESFLADGGERLPEVAYPPYEPSEVLALVAAARARIQPGGGLVDTWLADTADAIEHTARMLAAAGTPAFHQHSVALYGAPAQPMVYAPVTPLEMAELIGQVLGRMTALEIGLTPPPSVTAEEVADRIRAGLAPVFGVEGPPVAVVDDLSANASATASGIKVRRGALFTDRDADQLLQHEAFIHVATALNGRRQPHLRILEVGHPGTTRTQEGLAVYAEIMSQTAELDRMRRLADRVHAIQLAVDGADFIDVFRWYRERTPTPVQAFESARRVFRGGVLAGGAPFTKDVVYLFGLMQVASVVRAVFAAGRVDVLSLLFVGKVDVAALPALAVLADVGLIARPAFVPPWVADPRAVLVSLTMSTFLGRIDLPAMVSRADALLAACPTVDYDASVPG